MKSYLKIAVLSCLLGSAGCYVLIDSTEDAARHEAFREIIGIDAPPSVTGAESSSRKSSDVYVRWLQFSCDDAFSSKLRTIKGINAVKVIEMKNGPGDAGNRAAPPWWRDAKISSGLEELKLERGTVARPDIIRIWIDRENRMVYASRGRLF